jgi:hypothetical protein
VTQGQATQLLGPEKKKKNPKKTINCETGQSSSSLSPSLRGVGLFTALHPTCLHRLFLTIGELLIPPQGFLIIKNLGLKETAAGWTDFSNGVFLAY